MTAIRREKLAMKMAPVKDVIKRSNHAGCKLTFFSFNRNYLSFSKQFILGRGCVKF